MATTALWFITSSCRAVAVGINLRVYSGNIESIVFERSNVDCPVSLVWKLLLFTVDLVFGSKKKKKENYTTIRKNT